MSTIVIRYDGTDITHDILIDSASFESQLGAVAGSFSFIVRDVNQVHDFITGKEITLDIDGARYFGGYLTQVTRQLAFPVDDTTDVASVRTRQFLLRGPDYNILFDKRIIYNVDNPVKAPAVYPAALSFDDKWVLDTLFTGTNDGVTVRGPNIDLSGDGINVTTYVKAVADPTPTNNPDFYQGAFAAPGDPWRTQMESLSGITGALWYIDPNKNFHYHKYELTTPSWGFSDVPDHSASPPTYGFRELEYTEDATNLVNDAYVWGGSELGSSGVSEHPVYGHSENVSSEATHGRWQKGQRHFGEDGFFETGQCLIHSQVIVFGDPGADSNTDAERGLQWPQRQVKLTWFSGTTPTPLVPGTRVDVTLNVFGSPPIALALPVRSISITFPNPTSARFEGFLGIQTSDPWSLWKYMRQSNQSTTNTAGIVTSDGSVAATVPGTYVAMTPSPDPNGSNKVFVTTDPYVVDTLEVFLFSVGISGGLLQRRDIEYIETDSTTGTFTFITAPLNTDTLYVRYYSA